MFFKMERVSFLSRWRKFWLAHMSSVRHPKKWCALHMARTGTIDADGKCSVASVVEDLQLVRCRRKPHKHCLDTEPAVTSDHHLLFAPRVGGWSVLVVGRSVALHRAHIADKGSPGGTEGASPPRIHLVWGGFKVLPKVDCCNGILMLCGYEFFCGLS